MSDYDEPGTIYDLTITVRNANALLKRFRYIDEVLNASDIELLSIPGYGPQAVRDLRAALFRDGHYDRANKKPRPA